MAAPSCLSWFSLLGAILAQKTNLWDWITCAIGHYFPAGSQTAVPQSFSCTSLSSPQVHSFTFAFCYPSNIIRIWCLCSPPHPPQPCLGRLYILWGSWCLQIFYFFFWPSKNKICLEQGRGREGGECGPIMVRVRKVTWREERAMRTELRQQRCWIRQITGNGAAEEGK